MGKTRGKMAFLLLLTGFLSCGCAKQEEAVQEQVGQVVTEKESGMEAGERIGTELFVSRALAAKMISLTFYSAGELSALEDEIAFSDVKQGDWYYRYINGAVSLGIMQGSGEEFYPMEPLSLYEAQVLLKKIDRFSKTQIKVTEENRDKAVSYALWMELFQKAVSEAKDAAGEDADYGIAEKLLYVYATPANAKLAPWTMATNQGLFYFDGFSVDAYMDKEILCMVKDGCIVAVLEQKEGQAILLGAYIKEQTDDGLCVYMGGAMRALPLEGALPVELPCIADLKIADGRITEMTPYTETKSGVIKKAGADGIELSENGVLPLLGEFPVYGDKDGVVSCNLGFGSLICGTDAADFYMKDGSAIAAVVRREAPPEKIRVLLSRQDDSGYFFDKVEIHTTGSVLLEKNGESHVEEAGSTLAFGAEEPNGRILLTPVSEETPMTVTSIARRDGFHPSYYGSIELEKREEGYLLVNEVELERYLYSVVPSEMPAGYGEEAAKVQAVTARSYAYNQFYQNKFHDYGANVDDSTLCQVYNAIGEHKVSTAGVDATRGLCLTYEGEVVSANFFSTGAGVRANSGEVWVNAATKKFPSDTPPYLQAAKDYTGEDFGDLSTESAAKAFFKSTSVDSFDSDSCWFRWVVRMNRFELSAVVNANLAAQWEKSPFTVKTRGADGLYRSREIPEGGIGEVLDVTVQKRGASGNVMELCIKGSKAEVLISTEYAVRKVLSPVQRMEGQKAIVLRCFNGAEYQNYSLLPSAFFVLEKDLGEDGTLNNLIFFGGGNGHGVGMSQNGVKGMVARGYSYEEILSYYYPGTELVNKAK